MLLKELIGQKVAVWSGAYSDHRDEGVLEDFDAHWLCLRTQEGEMLCFCLYNVRLVKPLER